MSFIRPFLRNVNRPFGVRNMSDSHTKGSLVNKLLLGYCVISGGVFLYTAPKTAVETCRWKKELYGNEEFSCDSAVLEGVACGLIEAACWPARPVS